MLCGAANPPTTSSVSPSNSTSRLCHSKHQSPMVPAEGNSLQRSVNEFTYTSTISSAGSSRTDEYDQFSRVSGCSSAEVESRRLEKNLKARHRDACKKMNSGKFSTAINSFEGILADLLTRYEETHERIGAALHNIAVANLRANKLSDAKDAIEEAFRIRKTALGEQHPKVGDSLVEYGIILMALKENERALKVFHEALCAREEEVLQSKGTESSQGSQLRLAKVWHNIGCVNFKLGRLEEAQDSYAKAIEQQKNAFGNWNEALSKKGDATKPGFLTMASTICNQAYIELEQGNYANALSFFFDSLEIQRVLLEADNKLIATTMQNIGYAYCLKSDFGKAREIYKDLATLQQESYVSHAKKGWLRSIKNLIYCQLRLFDFQSAFETLRNLEDVLSAEERGVAPSRDLQTTHELMGEVNFQLLKIQSLSDYTQQLLDRSCGVCKWPTPERLEAIDAEAWFPTKPSNGSKMSGHRMSYA